MIESVAYDAYADRFIAVGGQGQVSVISAAALAANAEWQTVTNTGFAADETITAAIALSSTKILLAGPGKFAIVTP